MQRDHRVEQVRDVGDSHLETADGLVVVGLRVSEGGDRSLVHQSANDLGTGRQFRRDGHHLEGVAEQGVDVVDNGFRGRCQAVRLDHAAFVGRDEGPFEMGAEQMRTAQVAADALGGNLQMPVVLSGLVDRRRQKAGDAKPGAGSRDRRQGLRRRVERVRAPGPLNMHLNETGRHDPAPGVEHAFGPVRLANRLNGSLTDQDGAQRRLLRSIVQAAIRDQKRSHNLSIPTSRVADLRFACRRIRDRRRDCKGAVAHFCLTLMGRSAIVQAARRRPGLGGPTRERWNA